MTFSETLDYIFEAIGFAFIAVFIYTLAKGIYLRISYKFKPYNRKVQELERRKSLATETGNYRELQQIALEDIWLESLKIGTRNNTSSLDDYFKSKHEIEDRVYVNLSTTITEAHFILPNVHNVDKISFAPEFFDEILHKTEEARACSPYANTFYFPESVLPYPKMYLCFALNHLIERYNIAQERNDSIFEHFIKNRIGNLRYFNTLLNSRCIDLSADLLSVDETANLLTGDKIKERIK